MKKFKALKKNGVFVCGLCNTCCSLTINIFLILLTDSPLPIGGITKTFPINPKWKTLRTVLNFLLHSQLHSLYSFNKDFGRGEMEADPLKSKDCAPQWVAEASPGWALSSASKTEKKVSSSSGLDFANSTNESFSEQVTALHTSASSSKLGGDISLPGNMVHTQSFQETKPLNCLATSSLLPHVLPPNHNGVFPASPNNEFSGISCPSTAASPSLISQEALFGQNGEQVSLYS